MNEHEIRAMIREEIAAALGCITGGFFDRYNMLSSTQAAEQAMREAARAMEYAEAKFAQRK